MWKRLVRRPTVDAKLNSRLLRCAQQWTHSGAASSKLQHHPRSLAALFSSLISCSLIVSLRRMMTSLGRHRRQLPSWRLAFHLIKRYTSENKKKNVLFLHCRWRREERTSLWLLLLLPWEISALFLSLTWWRNGTQKRRYWSLKKKSSTTQKLKGPRRRERVLHPTTTDYYITTRNNKKKNKERRKKQGAPFSLGVEEWQSDFPRWKCPAWRCPIVQQFP